MDNDGSASGCFRPDQALADDGFIAVQAGPRQLWDELEHHHHAWKAAGSPTRDQLGITITPDADPHQIWINHPG